MFRMFRRILTAAALAGSASGASSDWPPLAAKGFIRGRPAQEADVNAGNAVFVAAKNGVIIGRPLPLTIPQYARLRDTNERVILVQAEEANGIKLYGVRGLDGKETVTKDTEVELLGVKRPH